jgi:hypothetical protein
MLPERSRMIMASGAMDVNNPSSSLPAHIGPATRRARSPEANMIKYFIFMSLSFRSTLRAIHIGFHGHGLLFSPCFYLDMVPISTGPNPSPASIVVAVLYDVFLPEIRAS